MKHVKVLRRSSQRLKVKVVGSPFGSKTYFFLYYVKVLLRPRGPISHLALSRDLDDLLQGLGSGEFLPPQFLEHADRVLSERYEGGVAVNFALVELDPEARSIACSLNENFDAFRFSPGGTSLSLFTSRLPSLGLKNAGVFTQKKADSQPLAEGEFVMVLEQDQENQLKTGAPNLARALWDRLLSGAQPPSLDADASVVVFALDRQNSDDDATMMVSPQHAQVLGPVH